MPPFCTTSAGIHKPRKPELQIATYHIVPSLTCQWFWAYIVYLYEKDWKCMDSTWGGFPAQHSIYPYGSCHYFRCICHGGFMTNTDPLGHLKRINPLLDPRSQFILPMFVRILNPPQGNTEPPPCHQNMALQRQAHLRIEGGGICWCMFPLSRCQHPKKKMVPLGWR